MRGKLCDIREDQFGQQKVDVCRSGTVRYTLRVANRKSLVVAVVFDIYCLYNVEASIRALYLCRRHYFMKFIIIHLLK